MHQSDERKLALCHRLEFAFIDLLSQKRDREARALGPVVDALYADNPEEDIHRCREGGVDIIDEINAVFFGIQPSEGT
jgi:hypothetical protein